MGNRTTRNDGGLVYVLQKLAKHGWLGQTAKRALELSADGGERAKAREGLDQRIALYQPLVELLLAHCGPLDGMRVLEVGCRAVPDFIAAVDASCKLAEAVGMNPLVPAEKRYSATLRIEPGDARHLGYPDRYFDLLISSAVFEHIQDFDVALAEMYRVLKPGGYLFSHFGPIWSGSYGHHLWLGDLTYHTLELPPFCHLLMDEAALRMWLEDRGEPKAAAVARYVFGSTEQNHLMFSDYERFVATSAFERVFLKGYDVPDDQQRYAVRVTAANIDTLNARYPADRDRFFYDGIRMLLRRPLVG
jgi:ubiquinone/menaquinone biosynthesis C-methylase UbiE